MRQVNEKELFLSNPVESPALQRLFCVIVAGGDSQPHRDFDRLNFSPVELPPPRHIALHNLARIDGIGSQLLGD